MKDLKYRFFPVLALGFFRVANVTSISLAIPLYYYQLGYPPSMIGLISSALTFTYIFSPLIFKNIPDRLGKKKSLVISVGAIFLIQTVFQFSLEPLLFSVLRMAEGIFLGLFWPALGASISSISAMDEVKYNDLLKDKIMKNYSLSWNLGGIFSFLLGTFVLFVISDLNLIFDFTLIFMGIAFIASLLFIEPTNNGKENENFVPLNVKKINNVAREYIKFPLYIPLFILIIYGFLSNAYTFLYPLKSEYLGFPLFTNYFIIFILSTSRLIFIAKFMTLSIQHLKKFVISSLCILIIVFVLMGISQNLIIFGILSGVIGFCLSILYCLSFKLIMFKNIAQNTSKYSSYFESTLGFSFFLGPVISGFIAGTSIDIGYFFLTVLSMIAFIIFIILKNKIES
ncbi:MAG: MFS transporter [Promethearchaeota archaeon]